MFDSIKRLFGEGKIRAEVTFNDGSFTAVKVPYMGDIDTLDAAEFRENIRRQMLVDYGMRVASVNIIGWTQS